MPATATPDLPTEPLLRLEPGMHWAPIKRIDVDAAGRFLVTGSDDRTVRVWSQGDGQLLKTLRVPLGEGNVGRGLCGGDHARRRADRGRGLGTRGERSDNSIYVFERAGGRIVARVDGLPNVIHHLAFSPDGRHLVACLGGSNGIRIYETGAFQETASDRDYGADSYGAAFDRAGRLVTSSYDGKIRLYDPGFRLTQSKEAPGGKRPFGVAFSPDGTRIAVGYDDSTRVDVLDGQTLAPVVCGRHVGSRQRRLL